MRWCQHDFIDSPGRAALFENYGGEGYGIYWRIVEHIGNSFDSRREESPSQTHTAQRWGLICGCKPKRFVEVAAFASSVSLISMTPAGPMQHGGRIAKLSHRDSETFPLDSETFPSRSAAFLKVYEINVPILLETLGSAHKKTPEKRPTSTSTSTRTRTIQGEEKNKESAAYAADKKAAPEPPADAEAPARTEQLPVAVETPEPPAKNAGGVSVSNPPGESFLTPPGMALIPFAPREDRRDALGWFRAVFWLEWPVKQNRQAAEKEALKIKPVDRAAIIDGLRLQAQGIMAMERPIHAATWLHQRRWEDAEHHVQRQFPMSATERAIQYGLDRVRSGKPL